jgi:hypothetical protein
MMHWVRMMATVPVFDDSPQGIIEQLGNAMRYLARNYCDPRYSSRRPAMSRAFAQLHSEIKALQGENNDVPPAI